MARYARIDFAASDYLTKYERNLLVELCEEDLEELAKNLKEDNTQGHHYSGMPDIFDD